MNDKLKLTVTMDVTISQALALEAMFEYWTTLGSIGSSRNVTFFCDGDGNFQPKCEVSTNKPIPSLTNAIRQQAIVTDVDGNRTYDFDAIAWEVNGGKE